MAVSDYDADSPAAGMWPTESGPYSRARVVDMRTVIGILVVVLFIASLYLISLRSFLFFHSLVELFTIIVATGIFVIAWNARAYLDNNYLLFVGIASIFVALLDLIHALAYKGIDIFPGQTANLPTQLWVAGRYLQSLSLLIAPYFLHHRLRPFLQITVFAAVTALLLAAILEWHIFPTAYVEGTGLTRFKKDSEYLVSVFLLGAVGLLFWQRREFDVVVWRLIVFSLILTVASEIAFASYVSVYGEANMIGHLLRLSAFYVLYKAIIETGLVRPHAILLRDLQLSQQQLQGYAATLRKRNEDLARSENQARNDAAVLRTRNEELDAYAHTVAHDLKTPLSVIIASCDLLAGDPGLTRPRSKTMLQRIESTAFRMDNIIDDLMLLAQVRKVDVPIAALDMATVVAAVRKRLNPIITERHARMTLPQGWPVALGYAPWIEEVWTNYLTNALKYGGDPPCITLAASEQPDGMIRFSTRDHGPGVPPDARLRLFIPFNQLGKVRRAGHGLGLSIVLHIVDKLGGQVGMEDAPDGGSIFYFTLPSSASDP